MAKDDTKKTVTKKAVNKEKTIKKVPAKKPATQTKKSATTTKKSAVATKKKPSVTKKVETAKKIEKAKREKELEKLKTKECIFCHEKFEEDLTRCPICRKKQEDNKGKILIIVLTIILILSIIANFFIDHYADNKISESDYKYNSKLLTYEELVRNPKEYKNTIVKVIGTVSSVEGIDVKHGNVMNVTIDANLFTGDTKHLIVFEYTDKDYQVGFIEGDLVTVYGEYKQINGNIPFIKSKYVVFGT